MGEELTAAGSGLRAHRDAMGYQAGRIDHQQAQITDIGVEALVGALIWAATFAWALEATPCRRARLLAIRDNEQQHRRLVRYFRQLGFEPTREVAAAALDLPLRLVWGGAGLLMRGDITEGLERVSRRL